MPLRQRMRFTDNVFEQDRAALLDVLEPSGSDQCKVQLWVDSHLAEAAPDKIQQLEHLLKDAPHVALTLPAQTITGGEACKLDPSHYERLLKSFNDADLDRRSYVICIGGGAVLDAVGFATATAHRGLRLVRLPTTTLSQADSGIGVKSAVNYFDKKNWLGSFAAPWSVITELGLVNLYVIAEPIDTAAAHADFALTLTACGETVHPNRERALRKALLEYIAARVRKTFMHGPLDAIRAIAPAAYATDIIDHLDPADEEPRALSEMINWLSKSLPELRAILSASVFATSERRAFSSLPSEADESVRAPADRIADLQRRLTAEDLSIYYFDATPPCEQAPRVVKALVPGLEGETLSYYRIGERGVRRLRNECPELVRLQTPGADGDLRIRLNAAAEARLGGAAYFDPIKADAIVGALYPLHREPASHTAQKRLAEAHNGK